MDSDKTKHLKIKIVNLRPEMNKPGHENKSISTPPGCLETGGCHLIFCDGCHKEGCDLEEHEDSLRYCGVCQKKRFCPDCQENDTITPTRCEGCYRGFCVDCKDSPKISKCHVCSGYLCEIGKCSDYYLECPKCQLKMCTYCDHLGKNRCPICDIQFKQT